MSRRTAHLIGVALDPRDRAGAGVMCLDADKGVPIDVIDEGRVELLLAEEHAEQKPPKAI